MRRNRPKNGLGIVAVVFVVLAACSSGSNRASPQPPTSTRSAAITTTTAPAPTSTGPAATTTTSSTQPLDSSNPTLTVGRWTGRRPLSIYFSGDGGNITTGLVWSSWNANGAVAQGTWTYLDCVPSCAAGRSTTYPVTITLSDPLRGQFTKLVEQTSGPHGSTQTFTAPQIGQGACTNRDEKSCAFA